MSKSTILRFAFICALLMSLLLIAEATTARHEDSKCDVEALIKHQTEHAQDLVNFTVEAKTDLDSALTKLYRTGIADQTLALECGFADGAAVEAAHELEHAGFDVATTTHVHSEDEEAQTLALAHSVGDPEQGKILFNTVKTEVSFACATCHRVDSTEMLIGPGLLGISGHNHSEAASGTPDAMSGMDMGEATAEATPAAERTFEQTVEMLRTSIVDPSASVMTGFPDHLMPQVYGTIFTEKEINDLVAYLLTLD